MVVSEPARRTAALAALVAVLAVVVFLPALRGEWLYDDHMLIEHNANVHSFAGWTQWFTEDFWASVSRATGSQYWRPLITVTYAVDWRLGGGDPFLFHLSNLVFHAAVGVLAFTTLRRWTGARWPAVLAALLFVLHPTKAESVAWISGRTDTVCAIALLLASQGMGRWLRRQRGGPALAVIGTVAAYACKEIAILLPAFAAIEAWVAAERPPIDRTIVLRMLRAALPQLVVAVGYLIARAVWLPISASMEGGLGFRDHLLVVLDTTGRYLALTFAPHSLSMQHGLVAARDEVMPHSIVHVAVGAIGTLALIVLAVRARRRWPAVTLGIAFYLVALVPTSNLKWTGLSTLVSERFLFVPTLGVAFVVGTVLASITGIWQRRAFAVAIAVSVAFAMLTLSRATDFVSEREFWAREAELHPDSTAALEFALETEIAERHFAAALATLGRIQEINDATVWRPDDIFRFVNSVALVWSQLTPDLDGASLRRIDQFVERALAGDRGPLSLELRGLRLQVPMPSAARVRGGGPLVSQLFALRAELRSRLGDDVQAEQLAATGRAGCGGCTGLVNMEAVTRARAGAYDEALAILAQVDPESTDPRIPATRANIVAAKATGGPEALATLGLWGRAYAALASAPTGLRFAEIAFKAGAPQVAARIASPAQLDAWAAEMGWTE